MLFPWARGLGLCAYSCLPDSKGLGPGGASPSIPAQCQRRWLPAQSQASQSSEPRSWGGQGAPPEGPLFPIILPSSQHLSPCLPLFSSPISGVVSPSTLPQAGDWALAGTPDPATLKAGQSPCSVRSTSKSLSNLFFHIHPDCPSLPGLAFILSCSGSCLSLPQALPAPGPSPPEGSS